MSAAHAKHHVALGRFNALPDDQAIETLMSACGSVEWARRVAAHRPYSTDAELYDAADELWRTLPRAAWLDAFAHHPQIGDSAPANAAGDQARQWSASEQRGLHGARPDILRTLAASNRAYRDKFGYIFIACASGKSAAELLALLEARLPNEFSAELIVAAEEQRQITRLRLEKLVGE